MKVLFCASEVTPFAKTGGLADVAGSLPLALGELGVETAIVMPRYRGITEHDKKLAPNVSVHFIENEPYFNRSGLYGNEGGDYTDNLQRFLFFCGQALALAAKRGFRADVVHANDWQTALLPVLLKTKFAKDPFFRNTKSLLTLHNLAYQGHFSHRQYAEVGLDPELFSVDAFEFHGKANVLKAGLVYSDRLNTVSPGYAREIKTHEYGCGLEGVLRRRADDLTGTLNGIDTAVWDPAKDTLIQKRFSAQDLSGKEVCKATLQKECGLEVNADVPLFGMVTRLADQKGVGLVCEIAEEFLSKKVQLVVLGDGDAVHQTAFKTIAARHSKNAYARIGFSGPFAHAVYAGSDFFLMPSLFEPCGLGQMIALRYGTVPVVRATGGLADTVADIEVDPDGGNGLVFKEPKAAALSKAIARAMSLFSDDKPCLEALKRRALKLDFSWNKSAKEYKRLYEQMMGSEGKS